MSAARVILITVAGPGGHVDVGVRSDATPADLADALGGVIGVSQAATVIEHRSPPRPGVPEGARVLVQSGTALAEAGVADGDLVLFRTANGPAGYSWPEVQGRPAELGASSPRSDAPALSSPRSDAAARSSPWSDAPALSSPRSDAAPSSPDFSAPDFSAPPASESIAAPAGRHARGRADPGEPRPDADPEITTDWPRATTEPAQEEEITADWPRATTEPAQEDQPRWRDGEEVSPGDWPG
jgi:hypothetical protein